MNVLLVHGLCRTPASLFGLAAALRRADHRPHFFAYSAMLEPLARITQRLSRQLLSLKLGQKPLGLIGHSLGGVLLRLALGADDYPCAPVLVTLGTPTQSPLLARIAWRRLPFRLVTRQCGSLLADPGTMGVLPALSFPSVAIVGTAGPRGRLTPFGDESNDGIVSVGEARAGKNDGTVLLPVWHTVMMDHPSVRDMVVAILSGPAE